MTLVLTELSPLGISMAAESAVTFEDRRTGILHVESDAARKLHKVTSLNAGVSCWGIGSIGGTPTDQWIEEFIAENSGLPDLSSFAEELASHLRSALGPAPGDRARLGFHIAGFEQYEGNPVRLSTTCTMARALLLWSAGVAWIRRASTQITICLRQSF